MVTAETSDDAYSKQGTTSTHRITSDLGQASSQVFERVLSFVLFTGSSAAPQRNPPPPYPKYTILQV